MKRFFSIIMCAILIISLLPVIAAAEEATATTMRLVEHTGTVTVKNASGKTLKITKDMRLYNNYQITTGRKSYAYISLDSSKAIKLDASSKVTISRQGRKLEILVEKGKLLFDVTTPLKKDETLNIRTSTMITGVRGTIGWIEIVTSQESELHLLEGSTLVTTVDPQTSSTATTQVNSGQVITTSLTQKDGQDTVEIEVNDLNEEDTPGFVRVAISEDPEMQKRIEENTDLNVNTITENAEENLKQEEQTAEENAEQIQQELENQVTEQVDPLFEQSSEPYIPPESTPEPEPEPEPIPTTYTVIFDLNGHGDAIAGQLVQEGGYAVEPTDPTADGFTFGGWFTEADCINKWNFTRNTVTTDLTLYAKWTANSYTITFNMNGYGDSIDSQTVTYGNTVTEPSVPTADGVTFRGWFTEADCVNEWNFAADTITGNLTLYAKWTANSYTVAFNMNGHGDPIDSQTIAYGGTVAEPPAPTADYFTFGGWFTEAECINEWNFAADTVDADLTLYAKWTIHSYTVTFNMNGYGDAIDNQTVAHGGTVTEPIAPSLDGFTFGGWFKEADCINAWNFASDTITADTTLYAKWTVNAYSVTFDLNGHGDVISSQTISHGGTVTEPTEPTAEGYIFGGWFTEADCINAWTFETDTVTADTVLYAKWTLNSYTVSFELNGHGDAVDAQTVDYNMYATEPTAPVADGYAFGGWFKDAALTIAWDFSTDTVTEDIILYAKWTATFTVTFDMNGYGDAVDAQTITEGGLVTEPTAPTADGYTFGGWFIEAACTIAWNFDTDTVTEGITLYAKWTVNSYTVSFEMNAYGTQIDDQTITHGGTVTEPTEPSEAGFTFNGWFADPECTTPWDFANNVITEDTVLYAKWTEIPETLTLTAPTVDEFLAALEEARNSEYTNNIVLENTALTLDQTVTVYSGDTLTLSSGSITIDTDQSFVINGSMLICVGTELINNGTITISESGGLLTNNGTFTNNANFSVSRAGLFRNTGTYADSRTEAIALTSNGASVSYLGLLSDLTGWTDGETLTLYGGTTGGDATLPETLLTIDGITVTLDLNGHTLVVPEQVTSGTACITVYESSALTVKDSSAADDAGVEGTGKITSASSYCTIACQGTFILEGGTIENTDSTGYYSPAIYSGGSPYDITIRGGIVSGKLHAISNKDQSGVYGNITVEGGVIEGGTCAIYDGTNSYLLLITGGTLVSNEIVIASSGEYDADYSSGTLISGNALLRLGAAYSEGTSAAFVSGGFTLESGMLMATDPAFFDNLGIELPQETGPESGYYTVDLTNPDADPTAWTLTDPMEEELLRVLSKSYVTTLEITDTDGNPLVLTEAVTIPDGITVTLSSGELLIGENSELIISGTLELGDNTTITNSGTISIGSEDFPNGSLVKNSSTFTNNGIYLDNTYLLDTNTSSYITVTNLTDDGSEVTVYCGAADGTSWFLSPDTAYTVTFYVADNSQFVIPDTFGDYESTVEINLMSAMLNDTQYTAAVTTKTGTLTLGENVVLCVGAIDESGETVTMPEAELFHFTGSITISSTAMLTSLYSTFEATNDTSVISVTGNGSADTANVELYGCTVTQNGSGAAIKLYGAYANLAALDMESESVAMTVTSSGAGIVCDTTSGIAASGMVLTAADTGIIYSGTGGSLMNCTITSTGGTGIECTGVDLLLNGCTVTSENGIGIENSGTIYFDVYENQSETIACTISGATYALYNTGSAASTVSSNTFILTSVDGSYTVFSDTADTPDAAVTLCGTFNAPTEGQIFSDQVKLDTDEVVESTDSEGNVVYYIFREYVG